MSKELTRKDIKKQTDAYLKRPKKERRGDFFKLPLEVQDEVRRILEGRRGFRRNQRGRIEFTLPELRRQIDRLESKRDKMKNERLPKIEQRISDLKGELSDRETEEESLNEGKK